MGWGCQYDCKGYCKLLHVNCSPAIKGCILNKGKHEYIFTTRSYEEDKKRQEESKEEVIDFAALARSN
jgi:hypothetical protein